MLAFEECELPTLGLAAVVLVAAVLHAVWNAIAKAVPDRVVTFALMGATHAGVAVLTLPFVAAPARAAWPWLAASALVHGVYNAGLLWSYRLGDFNRVYPLARGLGPLLVAVVAGTVLGEALGPGQLAGVVVVSGGIAGLTLAGGGLLADRPALAAAAATGVTIAAYTLLDGIGVRRSGSVLGYAAGLFLLHGLQVCVWAALVRRGALVAAARRHAGVGLAAGEAPWPPTQYRYILRLTPQGAPAIQVVIARPD